MPIAIEFFAAKNGMPTAKAKPAGRSPVLLHSSYDPEKEAKNLADRYEIKKDSIVIVFGLGLGYHMEEIFKRLSKENRVLLFENNETLINWAKENKNLPWERISIISEDEIGKMRDFISNQNRENIRPGKFIIVEHPPSIRLEEDYYKAMRLRVRDFLSLVLINIITEQVISRSVHENVFKNLFAACSDPGIENLAGAFAGKPAIIVSAGPSLAKNIDLLRKAKNKAVIMAVGTSLKPMQLIGIEPDLVVTLDPTEENYRAFEHLRDLPTKAYLCYEPQTYYTIPPLFDDDKRFVFDTNTDTTSRWLKRIYGPKGALEAGGTVAISAFELARITGANPIILVGQDLAYTDGFTHAKNTIYDSKRAYEPTADPKKDPNVLLVPSIHGGMIPTSRSFHGFLLRFEEIFQRYDHLTVIDATEGGAFKKGTIIMSLSRAIEKYLREEINVQQTLAELHNNNISNNMKVVKKAEKELRRVLSKYKGFTRKLEGLMKLSTEVVNINHQIDNPVLPSGNNDLFLRGMTKKLVEKGTELNKILKKINDEHELLDLLELLNPNLNLVRTIPEEADIKEQLEHIETYYTSYYKSAFQMIKLLEEVLSSHNNLKEGVLNE